MKTVTRRITIVIMLAMVCTFLMPGIAASHMGDDGMGGGMYRDHGCPHCPYRHGGQCLCPSGTPGGTCPCPSATPAPTAT
jgi:hypothetical protein